MTTEDHQRSALKWLNALLLPFSWAFSDGWIVGITAELADDHPAFVVYVTRELTGPERGVVPSDIDEIPVVVRVSGFVSLN